ncbi:hypothetical protein BDN71DRAFT_1444632 [Pleurotus eryngii]|uniref:Uncharacterized protein n=1 Tax=Pleurotus eryngii TaxID=5323 RepID=A0A9P6A1C1_PLEER|nr:hypothetical protein BDN71DRAFT_1444632 [Pleurotus eryngii]
MKFAALITSLIALPLSLGATVRWDDTYGNPSGSMSSVSCSDGANGLASRFPSFGKVPSSPHVGAVPGASWNSPPVRLVLGAQIQGEGDLYHCG